MYYVRTRRSNETGFRVSLLGMLRAWNYYMYVCMYVYMYVSFYVCTVFVTEANGMYKYVQYSYQTGIQKYAACIHTYIHTYCTIIS